MRKLHARFFFCTFATDLYAQSVLSEKASGLELTRKFIKTTFVGWVLSLWKHCQQRPQLIASPLPNSRFKVKVEPQVADNSALNAIQLHCTQPNDDIVDACKPTSTVGEWGTWRQVTAPTNSSIIRGHTIGEDTSGR